MCLLLQLDKTNVLHSQAAGTSPLDCTVHLIPDILYLDRMFIPCCLRPINPIAMQVIFICFFLPYSMRNYLIPHSMIMRKNIPLPLCAVFPAVLCWLRKKKNTLIKKCAINDYLQRQRQFLQCQEGTEEECSNHWRLWSAWCQAWFQVLTLD